MDRNFQHALVLLEQQRYDLAEEKLRQSLADYPDHALAHVLLAQCLCEHDKVEEATFEARQAIGLEPALAAAHAALARILHQRNRYDEALESIEEALRLEPGQADYFAQLSMTHLARRDWQAALDAAEEGLFHDPEHINCTNLRGMALVKLGRNEEAGLTIATALARDPEDAFSHANQGWTLLHEGKRQEALDHFREALRLEPGMEYAWAGIVEAMKAKNWIYGLLLRDFLWMDRLSGTAQWAVIVGGFLGSQALEALAVSHPSLRPWIHPIQIVYVIFALTTWLAAPFFNLLLRLDRIGRHALSREQVVASNWVGGLLALGLGCLAAWLATDNTFALLGAVTFGCLLLPTCGTFQCHVGWPRWLMLGYTLTLAFLALAWIPLALVLPDLGFLLFQIFFWGSLLSTWVANILMMQTPRR